MRLGLFYDTETTGLPSKRRFDDDPAQPHLVQIAAHLADMGTRKVIATIDLTVEATDWEIPDVCADIHGISTAHSRAVGIPEKAALDAFMSLHNRADVRIAHNEEFDASIMRFALMRYHGKKAADAWRKQTAVCTGALTKYILNLPASERMIAAGYPGPKMPRMEEAYKFFTGNDLANAHTAIADVTACMDVYWAAQDHNTI